MEKEKNAADGKSAKKSSPNEKEKAVQNIVNMGYLEEDVRRALRAAFDNPERAIEYLVDGIPESPSAPEGNTSYTSDASDVMPFEYFRTDPLFHRLRRSVWQNPEFMNTAIESIGEMTPQTLRYVNENHQEFVNMLFEQSEDEEGNEKKDR